MGHEDYNLTLLEINATHLKPYMKAPDDGKKHLVLTFYLRTGMERFAVMIQMSVSHT